MENTEWKMNHPIVYPTVDCAIFKDDSLKEIYLAKKPNEKHWRFVGGFADPADLGFETAAKREAKEETGLDCSIISYVASEKIDDPRYREKDDKIITTLFAMTAESGDAKATDDISELKLFNFRDLCPSDFVPEHRNLFKVLREWVCRRNADGDTTGIWYDRHKKNMAIFNMIAMAWFLFLIGAFGIGALLELMS